jgi:hypothetical protein
MLHLSQMIEDANHAVSNIQVVHGRAVMELMQRGDLTQEQKMAVIELFAPVVDALNVAQSKFAYNVG